MASWPIELLFGNVHRLLHLVHFISVHEGYWDAWHHALVWRSVYGLRDYIMIINTKSGSISYKQFWITILFFAVLLASLYRLSTMTHTIRMRENKNLHSIVKCAHLFIDIANKTIIDKTVMEIRLSSRILVFHLDRA